MSPRIEPAKAPYPPSVAKALGRLKTPGDEPLSLFRTLARDERLFARFTGGGLLDPGHLSLRAREIVIHRICAAGALHSTAFGKLSVRAAATGEASAAAPASLFGTGIARTTHHAQSVAPVALFGPARSGITAHPGGFHSTAFGAPCAGRVQPAGSVYREALWGAPSAAGYSAHSAGPAAIGAQFGAHIASCAYRALHLAPATRFGKPLMQRGNLC